MNFRQLVVGRRSLKARRSPFEPRNAIACICVWTNVYGVADLRLKPFDVRTLGRHRPVHIDTTHHWPYTDLE